MHLFTVGWLAYYSARRRIRDSQATTLLKMKKTLRETQTLRRAGCSKAEPKNFAPRQTPSRGRRTAKIQSAGDGHYLYLQNPVW